MQADLTEDERVYCSLKRLIAFKHRAHGLALSPHKTISARQEGRRRSRIKGRGLDFDELRPYQIGDDVRTIDWKVTSRIGRPHVRSYKEEKERPVLLVTDQRQSMFFGSALMMKSVAAAELTALMAWAVVGAGDRFGCVLFNDRQIVDIKPARSARQVMQSLGSVCEMNHALSAGPTERGTRQLNRALHQVERLARHDALILLVSDMAGWDEETMATIRRLRQHNELAVGHIVDPLEQDLPGNEQLVVSDGALQIAIDGSNRQLREDFGAAFEENRQRLVDAFRTHDVPVFSILTSQPVAPQLRRVLGG